MGASPSLRVITHPQPGLGFDATLRIARSARCFLAVESYIHGGSQVAFGIEPTRFPFLRVQLAPSTKLLVRLSLPLSEFKEMHASVQTTFYERGRLLPLDLASIKTALAALARASRPALEFRHRLSVAGMLLDDNQRRIIKEAVGEIRARAIAADRAGFGSAIERRGKRALKRWEQLPPLDPRDKSVVERRKPLERGILKGADVVDRLRARQQMGRDGGGGGGGGDDEGGGDGGG